MQPRGGSRTPPGGPEEEKDKIKRFLKDANLTLLLLRVSLQETTEFIGIFFEKRVLVRRLRTQSFRSDPFQRQGRRGGRFDWDVLRQPAVLTTRPSIRLSVSCFQIIGLWHNVQRVSLESFH